MAKVLCLLTDGFEEIETITPVDILRRAGVEVIIVSLSGSIHLTGRSGITIHADDLWENVSPDAFDLLFLPGGPGVTTLRQDGRAAEAAREFARTGKIVAAICAAPMLLADAGLLTNQRFTGHSCLIGELPRIETEERLIRSGNIITSRGAGTAMDLAFALVNELAGPETVERVAQEIMA